MDFNEFIQWLSEGNKAEFIYQGKYYDFISNVGQSGKHYTYLVMSNGMVKYVDGTWVSLAPAGSVEKEAEKYIEFVKTMEIEGVALEEIIDKKRYLENSLRKINGVVKNPYNDRNTNTIAEVLYFNYSGYEAFIEYLNLIIDIGGRVIDPEKYFQEADDVDYGDLYLFIGPSGVKGIDQVDDIYNIKLTEVFYICFEDINEFYIYLNQVKIEGILLRDILEQELFDTVAMAI